jgi:hypothetical protein
MFDIKEMGDMEIYDKAGTSYTCDRFDLNYEYQLLLPYNGKRTAKCRVSPDIEAGYYNMKVSNVLGNFKHLYTSR